MSWRARHASTLAAADAACSSRTAHSAYVESPRSALHPPGEKARGLERFNALLGTQLTNTGPGAANVVGDEVSPYTLEALQLRYEQPDPDVIVAAATRAWPAWRAAAVDVRMGVCLEVLDRLRANVFENAFATMHTTGQSFLTAFAGSGANALERGLEALVFAERAMRQVPATARFERSFGARNVIVNKRYRLMPRGLALVIACGSYPSWNAYPSMFANLATGNPVVLKPHPTTVLPMARAVQIARETLAEAGFDPNLVILAPDTVEAPCTEALVQNNAFAIVDFTGSQAYGAHLEHTSRDIRGDRLVYTETAGTNAVLLDSVAAIEPVVNAIARGLCLFSGQMCTTPQNLFVPPQIATADGMVARADVIDALRATVDALCAAPKTAAGLLGAIHNPRTVDRVAALGDGHKAQRLRAPTPYAHPTYPNARTMTPLLLEAHVDDNLHQAEHFGPVAFVIPTDDRAQALRVAARSAQERGAIASYAYSQDGAFIDEVEAAFFDAGASIAFNLVDHAPMNFTAAFSDYHVTALNPAGNACLTDIAFVASRFRIVQSKTEVA